MARYRHKRTGEIIYYTDDMITSGMENEWEKLEPKILDN